MPSIPPDDVIFLDMMFDFDHDFDTDSDNG
jgi:hypothetical protein